MLSKSQDADSGSDRHCDESRQESEFEFIPTRSPEILVVESAQTERADLSKKKVDSALIAAAAAVVLMLLLQVFFMALLYLILRRGF